MRTRIVRRFLWSAFVLLAISLFGVDLYVTQVTASNAIEDLRARAHHPGADTRIRIACGEAALRNLGEERG